MLGLAVLGALIAGGYGVLHDELTFSLCPEYFTKMKFEQFQAANFGLPERIFVAEIGFLATWWVGLIAGWLIARLTIPAWPYPLALKRNFAAFGGMLLISFIFGLGGWMFASLLAGENSAWKRTCQMMEIQDVRSFYQVACIHAGSYLGAVVGLMMAIGVLLHQKKSMRSRSSKSC